MGILLGLPGLVFAGLGLYLVTLAVAAGRFRSEPSTGAAEPTTRVAVIVPAHDEAALVARCIRSLLAQSYPQRLRRIIVVADNCTDDTAVIALQEGADVMVRTAPQAGGKGRALRWAMDALLAEAEPPDAIAVVDADSVAGRDMLAALVAELAAGHEAVQADYALLDEAGIASGQMAAIGFLLFHRVRFSGRRRLGIGANLVGNGMLFNSALLRRRPWDAFTPAEDLEYSIRLRLEGTVPRYAPSAYVWGPGPASEVGAVRQRTRWEGGRFHVVRTWLPRLIGAAIVRRDGRLLDAALDLATPPLGLLALVVIAGSLASVAAALAGIAPAWAALPWLIAAASVPAFVLIGLFSVGARGAAWAVIRGAPRFLAWKVATYTRLARGFDVSRWERTDRAVP